MMKAKFIVVEGLEGAGKSTAIQTVVGVLRRYGISDIDNTREPGGTVLAEKMRELVKQDHEGEVLQDMTELLLMYAARVQLVENVIKPSLAKGHWVVGDRHDMSSQAYQGGGRMISSGTLQSLRDITLRGFRPDLVLYLDIDPKIGLERARGRGELDRIEKMDLSFFERTRAAYLDIAHKDSNVVIIDAGQAIDCVRADIEVALENWLNSEKV
ncbi:dTMP kinase [Vibrio salinus]|uniref:dTMP kinase n=1 Tax=Vibrio salinus TaxID=2899784 RepID=UPI001E5492C3|nr:dTMP kinase [Vibrio salinus]MCE0494627.1 dTMP kinase [Vibrio salinus]